MKQSPPLHAFALLALLVVLPWNLRAQENLLKNPSFEDSNENGRPHHWVVYPGADEEQVDAKVECLEGKAAEGEFFLRMSKTGGTKPYELAQPITEAEKAGQAISVAGDREIILTGRIRGENLEGKNNGLAVQVFANKPDGDRHFVGRMTSDEVTLSEKKWTEVEVRFRLSDILPAGETFAYMDVLVQLRSNEGHLEVDNLALTVKD